MIHDYSTEERIDTTRFDLAIDDTPDEEGRYWTLLEVIYTHGDSVVDCLEKLSEKLSVLLEMLEGEVIPDWQEREGERGADA